MESKEDLQKLTVATLKEKLKQRHLTTTGTKSDLIERLLESFQEEENLLSGTEGNGELDVDALLGTNLPDDTLTSKEEALLLGLTSKTENSSKPTETSKLAVSPQKIDLKPKATIESPVKSLLSQASPTKTEASNQQQTDDSAGDNGNKATLKPARQPIRQKITTESVDDAKKRRAERFGLATPTPTDSEKKTSISDSDKHPISLNSSSKLLERAKRFGLPVQKDDGSNGVSNPKIPRISSTEEEDEVKKRRMQRFAT